MGLSDQTKMGTRKTPVQGALSLTLSRVVRGTLRQRVRAVSFVRANTGAELMFSLLVPLWFVTDLEVACCRQ